MEFKCKMQDGLQKAPTQCKGFCALHPVTIKEVDSVKDVLLSNPAFNFGFISPSGISWQKPDDSPWRVCNQHFCSSLH